MARAKKSVPGGEVAVIGAGIVGVCCALYLQRHGHSVRVFDPGEPGEGASSGNAGYISPGSCVPTGMPGLIAKVPGMLLDPLGPLTIRWRYLPRIAPWLVRLVAASSPARVERITDALRALYRHAVDDFTPLVKAARATALIRNDGRLEVYRDDRSLAKADYKYDLMRRRGVELEVLDAAALHELVPALSPEYTRAVHLPGSSHTTDPLRLTQALAADFRKRGGAFVREEVRDVQPGAEGRMTLVTGSGRHEAAKVVLAAGAYSRRLAARLGSRVPLDTERGYHMMLPKPGIKLKLPVSSGDHHFAITPMAGGIRLAGTDEFAGLDAEPNYARADKLFAAASLMFPGLKNAEATRWMGRRPSIPDSVPVISGSPVHPNVFFAFGHGHLGLTGAAVTGRLIAELASGQTPAMDMAPYRVDRF